MILSDHGEKRLRKRSHIRKKNTEKFSDIISEYGLRHRDTTGSLRRYMDRLWYYNEGTRDIIAYNQKIYIIGYNDTLITVFDIPFNLRAQADKQQKREK